VTHHPDIRVLDLDRGAKLRLTYDAATDASPVWSPDGRQIAYRSNRAGVHDLYQKPANGAGQPSVLLKSESAKYPTGWTAAGQLVFHTYRRETGSDIWMVSADGSRPTPIVQTTFDEVQGQLSEDSRWLAYTSLESGQPQVYIRSMSDMNRRWQVSADGGTDPRWRGDGLELFFISSTGWLMAVEFNRGAPAAARRLFQVRVPPPTNPYLSSYDVTADGKKFLVKVSLHDVMSQPIQVMTNWTNARRTLQVP
jgi:Tol biopolymer transport system component